MAETEARFESEGFRQRHLSMQNVVQTTVCGPAAKALPGWRQGQSEGQW